VTPPDLLERLVLRRVPEPLDGILVRELVDDERRRLPVALEDQGVALRQDVAATGACQQRADAIEVFLEAIRVVHVEIDDNVRGHCSSPCRVAR
jgi:hypothetical protein